VVVSSEIVDLRNHVEMLEIRLEKYHEYLSLAIKERDELALDAAWGNTQSSVLIAEAIGNAFLAAVTGYVLAQYVSIVVAVGVGTVVFFIAQAIGQRRAWAKVNKMRLEEKASLPTLPEWKDAEKYW